jgi:hypothetical protein
MRRALGIGVVLAVLLAGCGGSSHSSGSSSGSISTATTTAGETVTSTDKSFVTVTPQGFTDQTSSSQASALKVLYLAIGPRANGFSTNINVVREPSHGLTDVSTIANAELATIKRLERQAHSFSELQSLTVGGEQARSVDYLNTPAGTRELHQRQVFVQHGGSIYTITYTALPAAYAASSGAMDQLLNRWTWR